MDRQEEDEQNEGSFVVPLFEMAVRDQVGAARPQSGAGGNRFGVSS
jgi:hypothetical protein